MNIATIPPAVASTTFDSHHQELRFGSEDTWSTQEIALGAQVSKAGEFAGIAGAIAAANALSNGSKPGVAVVWNGEEHVLFSLTTNLVEHRQRTFGAGPKGAATATLAASNPFVWTDLATGPFGLHDEVAGAHLSMIVDDGRVWEGGPLVGGTALLRQTHDHDIYLD
jgi:hypothetical protein